MCLSRRSRRIEESKWIACKAGREMASPRPVKVQVRGRRVCVGERMARRRSGKEVPLSSEPEFSAEEKMRGKEKAVLRRTCERCSC